MKKQQQQQAPPLQVKMTQIVQPEPFWTYLQQSKLQPAIDQYLQINQKDVYTMQNSGGSYLDNIKLVLSQINGYIHPTLSNQQLDVNFIRFANIKVDWLSLKLLQTFLVNSQVSCIDFRYNSLTEQELELIYSICSNQTINKVFIEFNSINCIKLSSYYNIQFLYLRGNQINDVQITQFMSSLHNRIQVLELGTNCISKIGCDSISEYLSKANAMEYLGLGRNNLNSLNDIRNLCNQFGKTKLVNEEVQRILDLENQRELQIQKYTKQKKKYTDEMLIQVPYYQKIDGFYFNIQNPQFKILNLSDNKLPETDREHIDRFMNKQLEQFVLILQNNQFENSTKAKWRKKYKRNLLI